MSYISWDEYYNIANEVYKELGTINVPVNFEFKGYSIISILKLDSVVLQSCKMGI